jgi:hypothetical protein
MSEFEEDIGRVKSIKKLLGKYLKNKTDLNERLILNHIIILANVFGVEFSVRLLFFNMSKEHYSVLTTFLLYLDYIKEKVCGIEGKDILISDIPIDMQIAGILRKI